MADTLLNMKAFLICARTGSFSEAGRQLGIATSVVTKRVNQLEWALKAKLLKRTTRSVKLTEMGERYIESIRNIVGDYDDIVAGILRSPTEIEGHLRVKAPASLTKLLGDIFAGFQRKYPRITLDISVNDRALNPVEEGLDLTLSLLPNLYDGVVEESLHAYPRLLCASRDYIERRGTPSHPSEVTTHDCLAFSPAGAVWSFQSPRGLINIPVRPRLITNDIDLLLAAVKAGDGLAVVSKQASKNALREGTLVPLLPEFPIPDYWLRALIPQSRTNLARVKTLVAHIREALQPVPPWDRN